MLLKEYNFSDTFSILKLTERSVLKIVPYKKRYLKNPKLNLSLVFHKKIGFVTFG